MSGAAAAEPYVRIEGVTKRFGGFTAVDDVSLDIQRGEIFCLLGGSGSGKTTLLRMLAGFEQPSAGRVLIDGQDMSAVPPHARPVNMMFQSYALFPHMSVERNIAFGLEQERLARAEIRRRVGEMLELVKLAPYAARKPHQLSGGQRQRVALARALVKRPKLLLLDEPLAALDRKLREHTQFELINIQERLGVTFVVVTHDQEEAMTLSSRMGVMNQGRIVQVGTPAEIYETPATRFVADFIGSVNLFEGQVTACDAHELRIRCADVGELAVTCGLEVAVGRTVWVAIRPERIELSAAAGRSVPAGLGAPAGLPAPLHGGKSSAIPASPPAVNRVAGIVAEVSYRGGASIVLVRLPSGRMVRVTRPNTGRAGEPLLEREDEVSLSWHAASPVVLTE